MFETCSNIINCLVASFSACCTTYAYVITQNDKPPAVHAKYYGHTRHLSLDWCCVSMY